MAPLCVIPVMVYDPFMCDPSLMCLTPLCVTPTSPLIIYTPPSPLPLSLNCALPSSTSPLDCCMCCSNTAAAVVDSRAASAPQSRVLGWTRNLLGLAAHIWVPGLLCWNDIKPLLLDCNGLCCPGSALDDWSAPQPNTSS